MSQTDPTVPSRKVENELRASRLRAVDAAKIIDEVEEAFRPARELGERNHIAWKLKLALAPSLTR